MRPIKFRAWVDDSMWTVNGLACSDETDEMDLIDHSIGGYDEVFNYDYTKDCILMQYTGLKDKNGKEIYEGDIVSGKDYAVSMLQHWKFEAEEKNELYIVKYHEASFKLFDIKDRWVAVLNHHVVSMVDKLSVIGNIYENPELLEQEATQ